MQKEHEKLLARLMKQPENNLCADCNSKSPTWVSLDYGVFVCMNCSGAHRALGPRNTRVKSTQLDEFKPEWVELLTLGNLVCNEYWEHCLPDRKKPNPGSTLEDRHRYLIEKYIKRKFAPPGEEDPITLLKEGRWKPKQQELRAPQPKPVEQLPPRQPKQNRNSQNWQAFTNPVKKTPEAASFDKTNPFNSFKSFDNAKSNQTTFSKFGTTGSNSNTASNLPKNLTFNTHSGSSNNFDVFNHVVNGGSSGSIPSQQNVSSSHDIESHNQIHHLHHQSQNPIFHQAPPQQSYNNNSFNSFSTFTPQSNALAANSFATMNSPNSLNTYNPSQHFQQQSTPITGLQFNHPEGHETRPRRSTNDNRAIHNLKPHVQVPNFFAPSSEQTYEEIQQKRTTNSGSGWNPNANLLNLHADHPSWQQNAYNPPPQQYNPQPQYTYNQPSYGNLNQISYNNGTVGQISLNSNNTVPKKEGLMDHFNEFDGHLI